MKNIWPVSFGLLAMLAAVISLAGCGSLPNPSPVNPNTAPSTVAYMFTNAGITGFSIVSPNVGSPIGTLTPPPTEDGPVATDSTGQIYVPVSDPADPLLLGSIFVYPPNSTGAAAPLRTIAVNSYSYAVSALTVDPAGRLYVAIANGGAVGDPPPTVLVYSAGASGQAVPLRILQLTTFDENAIQDMAADAAGNIYCAGYINGIGHAIAVYSPTANGPATPTRMITFGTSNLSGVAVNSAGNIFASVGSSSVYAFFIEEFAPGASGAAAPINTINLPLPAVAPWGANGGPVRLDGAGNIFTSMEVNAPDSSSVVVYGFGPTATGSVAPTVQFIPTDDNYRADFAVN